MRDKVRVILWGLGSMGSGIARIILKKKGFTVVGAIDMDPNKAGKRLYEVLDLEPSDANQTIVSADPKAVVKKGAADMVVIATTTWLKQVFPLIKMAVEAGINVVTTAEEMAYPKVVDPDLTKEMDRLAEENKVAILGTGINPGFIMDYLVITLTGVCEDISKIKIARVNDFTPYGIQPMEDLGIGLTPTEFQKEVAEGNVPGHVGFLQGFGMFEEAFNIKFSKVGQTIEPIIAKVPRVTNVLSAKSGEVAGCKQLGFAYKDDKLFIEMEHPQQIRPEIENVATGDYITIEGTPNINLRIEPEIAGGIVTTVMCVNMIPHVLNATPGLKTMLDLPAPRAIMSDVRELIKK